MKKFASFLTLFSFLLSNIHPTYAGWDDFLKGRQAFEEGDSRQAYHHLSHLPHRYAFAYLEKLHEEGTKKQPKDRTEKDLTADELEALCQEIETVKQHPMYFAAKSHELKISLALRSAKKEKKPHRFKSHLEIIKGSAYGAFQLGRFYEKGHPFLKPNPAEAAKCYEAALLQSEVIAFLHFSDISPVVKRFMEKQEFYETEAKFVARFTNPYEGLFKLYPLRNAEAGRHPLAAQHAALLLNSAIINSYNPALQQALGLRPLPEPLLEMEESQFSARFPTCPYAVELEIPAEAGLSSLPSNELLPETLDLSRVSMTAPRPSLKLPAPHTSESQMLRSDQDQDATNLALLGLLAENGDNDAAYVLSAHYQTGDGVPASLEKTVFWLQKAAALGNIQALNQFGFLYEQEVVGRKDLDQALSYYRQAAAKEDLEGLRNVARLIEKESPEEAVRILNANVSRLHAPSLMTLAHMLTFNPIVKDLKRAAHVLRGLFSSSQLEGMIGRFKTAIDSTLGQLVEEHAFAAEEEGEISKFASHFGLSATGFQLGQNLLEKAENEKDPLVINELKARALPVFWHLATAGNTDAQFIALNIVNTLGIRADLIGPLCILLENMPDTISVPLRLKIHRTLGITYERNPETFNENFQKAAAHYEKAIALYGHLPSSGDDVDLQQLIYNASLNLGYLHMSGSLKSLTQEKPDYKKAFELTMRASEILNPQGIPYALSYYNLAQFYRNGWGIPENPREAFRYMNIAAGNGRLVEPKGGDLDALHDLGLMYFEGTSYLQHDLKKARALFERAVALQLPRAFLSLAGTYNVSSPDRNILKAIMLLEKGMTTGDTTASECALLLGYIYLIGEKGIFEADIDKASSYFQKAVEMGLGGEELSLKINQLSLKQQAAGLLKGYQKKPRKGPVEESSSPLSKLIDELQSTELSPNDKWRKVDGLMKTLMKAKGGIQHNGSGSVRHLQLGETLAGEGLKTSLHQTHKPGKERGIGMGRARDMMALRDQVIEDLRAQVVEENKAGPAQDK